MGSHVPVRAIRRCGRAAALAALALSAALAAPDRASAQQDAPRGVQFTPRPDRPVERRLERFVEGGDYRLWIRDTTLARGDTVPGDVLVLESMVRLEGRVEGNLVAVDSDVFLRPNSAVAGDLMVLGGGMYRSSLSSVEGEVAYEPNLLLQAVPRQGGWEIVSSEDRPDFLRLDGVSGLHVPSAQRVDGWAFSAGGRLQAADVPWQPSLHLDGTLRTRGGRAGGSARQYWYPSGRWRIGVEGGRGTRTNERWIRSDVANTLTHVFGGRDYRNYHESDRVLFGARHDFGGGETAELTAGWERVRPLPARHAGGLFGDDAVEPNPSVDAGDDWRVALETGIRRTGGGDTLSVDLRLAGADAAVAGDFSYLFGEAAVDWRIPAAAGHRVSLRARARGDLAGELPRHRWSAVGGAGTLPTLDVLELRGARLLFGRATYVIPLPVLRVPRLGGPELLLRAASGTAWSGGGEPDPRANLAAGVRFLIFEGGVAWDPGSGPGDEVRGFLTVQVPR